MENVNFTNVPGDNRGSVYLFALSTCIWCKKTKELLDNLGIEYNYVFVDHLDEDHKSEVRETLKKYNSNVSYPTIVINDSTCIVGYDEERVEKEVGRG
ncbi:MAG: glutaredoxin family protein [Spirochaetota bacterium]